MHFCRGGNDFVWLYLSIVVCGSILNVLLSLFFDSEGFCKVILLLVCVPKIELATLAMNGIFLRLEFFNISFSNFSYYCVILLCCIWIETTPVFFLWTLFSRKLYLKNFNIKNKDNKISQGRGISLRNEVRGWVELCSPDPLKPLPTGWENTERIASLNSNSR